MPVMPIPRRMRSFHGPHTTCLHAACGPARTSRPARTKYNNFDVYVRARWLYGFIRFLLYFSCSLFTAVLCGALAALFCLEYLGVRVLLRFQLKLSALLLLLGLRRVDFRLLNALLIHGIRVTVLLVGGLGWCFMVFVDIEGQGGHHRPCWQVRGRADIYAGQQAEWEQASGPTLMVTASFSRTIVDLRSARRPLGRSSLMSRVCLSHADSRRGACCVGPASQHSKTHLH
ncbi:hypothetical protein MC885_020888 [Smutsia gigantea]|nr:hypothetical protein MC885_020888 [Smutsia gigantea]